jgi:poly(A) polymerase
VSTVPSHYSAPLVLPRAEHTLSRNGVSSAALKVLYRLHRAGYVAYLVGGSVRDVLLGRRPKDFDVVTNAQPREIRRLFRNSRVIGRRFRLVHVLFAGETVEVATFRASPEPDEVPDGWEEGEENEDGEETEAAPQVDENNVFGTPAEDARRRDFTVNALFYNIADFSIIDHVGGLEDLRGETLRTIGDPDQRIEEDPVRMLRALEYMVRLGFKLEPRTEDAIHRNRDLILAASPARLAYELLETLRSGVSRGIFAAWKRFGILRLVFPEAEAAGPALNQLLVSVDRRFSSGEAVDDAVLLGLSFLPDYVGLLHDAAREDERIDNPQLLAGLAELIDPAELRLHLSNRNVHQIRQGLFTISKMRRAPERARQVIRLARQDYFPTAWALYTFAVEAKLLPAEPHRAWADALDRLAKNGTLEDANQSVQPTRRRRRRPRRRRRS